MDEKTIDIINDRGCDYCRGVHYTDEPFRVRTQMGNIVEVTFNYCPYCGRDLKYE